MGQFKGKFYNQVKSDGNLRITRHFYYCFENIKIEVKRGFLTDGASVPYRARNMTRISDLKYLSCAAIHDALYRTKFVSRKKADLILDDMLKVQGMSRYERAKVYYLLRALGSPSKDKELLENAKKYVRVYEI